jgi:hypothetical protein
VHDEYKNDTSREISKVMGNFNFLWNDLIPYSPESNDNFDQVATNRFVRGSTDDLTFLLDKYWTRARAYIDEEIAAGGNPIIVIAGITANLAFECLRARLPLLSIDEFTAPSQLRIQNFGTFTVILGGDHPSAYMMARGNAEARQRHKDTWRVAEAMRRHAHTNIEDLLAAIDKEISERHRRAADAHRRLGIPSTAGWLEPAYAHLRSVNWAESFDAFKTMHAAMPSKTFLYVLKFHVNAHMSNDYASKVVGFYDKLGNDNFVTWMNDGVAARLMDDPFNERMMEWRTLLGNDKFVPWMVGGVAARWLVIPLELIEFLADNTWTQKMTHELCRRVPKGQLTAIDEHVWLEVHATKGAKRKAA